MDAPCASALAIARTIVGRTHSRLGLARIGQRLIGWFGGLGLSRRLFRSGKSGRRRAPARAFSPKTRSLRFEVPAQSEMVGFVRERAGEFARSLPFTNQEIEDIRLAVGEAVVNAIQHGVNPRWRKVGVEMRARGNTLRVAVWDRGRGFDPRKLCRTAECLAERGRGIFFMRTLMDEVRFRFTNPGTRVEMTKVASRAGGRGSRRADLTQRRRRI